MDNHNIKVGISCLLSAIHYIRKSHNQPLTGLKGDDQYNCSTEESMIFLTADKLGIDLGGERGIIDVTDFA